MKARIQFGPKYLASPSAHTPALKTQLGKSNSIRTTKYTFLSWAPLSLLF